MPPGTPPVRTAAQAYVMLGNAPLWDAARRCHAALAGAGIPHLVAGGVAVCLHGYQRNTVDLDLLVRRDDADAIRTALESAGFEWSAESKEFRDPLGVPVQFILSGDRAGTDAEVHLSDPTEPDAATELEGLPVLSLPKLIETKIACGLGNRRRTHKDLADVVELIAAHNLSRSFARRLHPSVRPTFRELVLRVRGGGE